MDLITKEGLVFLLLPLASPLPHFLTFLFLPSFSLSSLYVFFIRSVVYLQLEQLIQTREKGSQQDKAIDRSKGASKYMFGIRTRKTRRTEQLQRVGGLEPPYSITLDLPILMTSFAHTHIYIISMYLFLVTQAECSPKWLNRVSNVNKGGQYALNDELN